MNYKWGKETVVDLPRSPPYQIPLQWAVASTTHLRSPSLGWWSSLWLQNDLKRLCKNGIRGRVARAKWLLTNENTDSRLTFARHVSIRMVWKGQPVNCFSLHCLGNNVTLNVLHHLQVGPFRSLTVKSHTSISSKRKTFVWLYCSQLYLCSITNQLINFIEGQRGHRYDQIKRHLLWA